MYFNVKEIKFRLNVYNRLNLICNKKAFQKDVTKHFLQKVRFNFHRFLIFLRLENIANVKVNSREKKALGVNKILSQEEFVA